MTANHAKRSGFTLVELVVTMTIVGILGFAAASRFSGTAAFDQRRFFDESLAAIRFAQKTAIAQHRNVCVTFTTTTVTLTAASTTGSAVSCSPGVAMTTPTGASPFVVTAGIGVTFTGTPTAFHFDALGRPRDAADAAVGPYTIQVTGASRSITVEAETGYVY